MFSYPRILEVDSTYLQHPQQTYSTGPTKGTLYFDQLLSTALVEALPDSDFGLTARRVSPPVQAKVQPTNVFETVVPADP